MQVFHFLSYRPDQYEDNTDMKLHSLIAAALLAFAADSHAGLIHKYELNGDLSDAMGGASLVKFGDLSVGPSAYAFNSNMGLGLSYELGSVYTIDMRFQLASDWGGYQRLLNFQYADHWDNGLYVSGDDYCFYINGCTGSGTFKAKQDIRLSVTRDTASRVSVFQNGSLLFGFDDSTGQANLSTPAGASQKRLLSFFKDDGGGEAATGTVDFIHLYNNALDAQQVAALHGAEVAEPASLGLVGAGLALLGWTRRRKPQGANQKAGPARRVFS